MTPFKWILLVILVGTLAFLGMCELRKSDREELPIPPIADSISWVDTLYISSVDTVIVERPDVMARLKALEAHHHGCRFWSIERGPYGCD